MSAVVILNSDHKCDHKHSQTQTLANRNERIRKNGAKSKLVFRTCGQRIQIALSKSPEITNIKPAIHRTIEPLNHGSIEPTIHRTSDPSIHQTIEPANHGSIEPKIHRTKDPSNQRSIKPKIHRTNDPSNQ